jgi:hypothetical protein
VEDEEDEKEGEDEEDEEGEEEEEEKKEPPKRPPRHAGGRPSKREAALTKELEGEREEREKDRLARIALEKKVEQLMAKMDQDTQDRNVLVFSGSSASSVTTPEVTSNGSSSNSSSSSSTSSASNGSISSQNSLRYMQLREFSDEMANVDELARVKKENMLMRRAMWGDDMK